MTNDDWQWFEIGREAARSRFATQTDAIFALAMANCAVPSWAMQWFDLGWQAAKYADSVLQEVSTE